jgi:hypothetical protein
VAAVVRTRTPRDGRTKVELRVASYDRPSVPDDVVVKTLLADSGLDTTATCRSGAVPWAVGTPHVHPHGMARTPVRIPLSVQLLGVDAQRRPNNCTLNERG